MLVNISHAKPDKIHKKVQDGCRTELEEKNEALHDDDDGILNEDEIASYENCVNNVKGDLDMKNTEDLVFLFDCYIKVFDYYYLSINHYHLY